MDETGIERHLGLAQPTGTHLEGGRQQGADAECHFMIEAWHRVDERDGCESMAIADTSVSAGLMKAVWRPFGTCPAAST